MFFSVALSAVLSGTRAGPFACVFTVSFVLFRNGVRRQQTDQRSGVWDGLEFQRRPLGPWQKVWLDARSLLRSGPSKGSPGGPLPLCAMTGSHMIPLRRRRWGVYKGQSPPLPPLGDALAHNAPPCRAEVSDGIGDSNGRPATTDKRQLPANRWHTTMAASGNPPLLTPKPLGPGVFGGSLEIPRSLGTFLPGILGFGETCR